MIVIPLLLMVNFPSNLEATSGNISDHILKRSILSSTSGDNPKIDVVSTEALLVSI